MRTSRFAVTFLTSLVLLSTACSNSGTQQPNNPNTAVAATPALEKQEYLRLEGAAGASFDSIIEQAAARELGQVMKFTIATLTEDLRRPPRSAIFTGTVGGFDVRDTVKLGTGNPVVAVFCDNEVEVEAHSDGSNAKITSDLTGTVAKVYGDLLLPESKVMIRKGTILRRSGGSWTAFNDAEIEKRLDGIEKGDQKGSMRTMSVKGDGLNFQGFSGVAQ